ncbi:MAG: GYF domain-containing protein, partial [Planktothrix sp.]
TRDTLVWHSGLPGWTAAAQIPELAAILPPPPPPAL